jgi:exopolysaccharide biosynthesis polyprenyl glycosylphosphotransferase
MTTVVHRPAKSARQWLRRIDAASLDRLLTTAPAARAQGRQWKRVHHQRVLAVDTLILVAAVAVAQVLTAVLPTTGANTPTSWPRAMAISAILVTCWIAALALQQTRDISLVGIGSEEYRRVVAATAWVFGLIAVADLLLHTHLSRLFLVTALLFGLTGLIVGRHRIRRTLARRRIRGEFLTRVVVLGRSDSVAMLCESFLRSAATGYRIVGVCIPAFDGAVGDELVTPAGVIPVLGDENAVETALTASGADALAVAAVEHLGHHRMKQLAWRLESIDVDLIVVPGVTDIAGHRLRMRPIDNLPLFHIAPPKLDGPSAVAKRLFDLAFGAAALVAAVPVLLLAALAIKLDDGGPVLFRQVRVGHRGKPFRIIKFRTMTVDAEAKKAAEQVASGGAGVFYKSACDSRITRVGRFLRATSIDELPQILNVLGGAMSIVGPRPLVPGEGDSVEDFIERRALVKPGITGLWQISGRSDVSDKERIRLDHSYVDNWSYVLDLLIVWRTVRAVLKRQGAY